MNTRVVAAQPDARIPPPPNSRFPY
jgi:hypothetical protein